MNTQYQNFGEFLQRKRTEKQITLRKMAEMIGITAPYLTDIEKDRRNPPEKDTLLPQTCPTISWSTTMCPLRYARHATLMQARLTG